jgi:ribosome modulation factor
MSRTLLVKAIAAGAAAGKAGKPVTACPFEGKSLLRSAWIRGYARARPVPQSGGSV